VPGLGPGPIAVIINVDAGGRSVTHMAPEPTLPPI
jgi:hypothetical protein